MVQIQDKLKELPEDVGEDFSKAESFHRMHAAFERDITALGQQVEEWEAAPAAATQTLMIQAGEPGPLPLLPFYFLYLV